jgi:dipeptidyl aminopeptidase/acylaminoacyl peptidase
MPTELAARWLGRLVAAAFGALVVASATLAQTPDVAARSIPAVSFFRDPDIGEAKLSPSGRWLAVKTGIDDKRIRLVTFDLLKGGPSQQAARFDNADIGSFHWVNDDRLVFTLTDHERGSGDLRVAPGLFSVKPDGSALRQLVEMTRRPGNAAAAAEGEPLNATHVLLAVPTGEGEQVIVGERSFDRQGRLQSIRVKRLDVASGRVSAFAIDGPPNAVDWLFDPRGEPRVIVSVTEGMTRVHWRAPGKKEWIELARMGSLSPSFIPRLVDSAGDLYVTAIGGPGGTSVLKRFDFRAGPPFPQTLASAPGFDVTGEIVVDADSGLAAGVRVDADRESTVWFRPRMKALQQVVDAKLPGRVNRITCSRCELPEAVVLVYSFSDRDPGKYWIYRPQGERWTVVGQARRDIDPSQMSAVTFHRIRARDGLELPLWITTPHAPSASPRPAVVLVHGGPWIRGGHWQWSPNAQFLASRGYLVIEPEFRGSGGFGGEHFRAGWKQWGLAMQDDVADTLQWVVDQGWADPRRACIAGASYGGYAALMGLARHPEAYRCGAAWMAITDPRMLFDVDIAGDVGDATRRVGLRALVGDAVDDAAAMAEIAPVEMAARIKAPLLLAYGTLDRRVPLEHGSRMRAALRAAGVEPEWITYEGEGHGWQILDNRVDFAKRLESFLARNLE